MPYPQEYIEVFAVLVKGEAARISCTNNWVPVLVIGRDVAIEIVGPKKVANPGYEISILCFVMMSARNRSITPHPALASSMATTER